jgi:hypothetical protein
MQVAEVRQRLRARDVVADLTRRVGDMGEDLSGAVVVVQMLVCNAEGVQQF